MNTYFDVVDNGMKFTTSNSNTLLASGFNKGRGKYVLVTPITDLEPDKEYAIRIDHTAFLYYHGSSTHKFTTETIGVSTDDNTPPYLSLVVESKIGEQKFCMLRV